MALRARLHTTWRYARWGVVAAVLPLALAVHVAVIAVLAFPFDADELITVNEPLRLVDVRGETIAMYPAVGADRTRWTKLGDVPAIAVSAIIESEDENFWRHGGVDGEGIARAVWLDLQGGRFGGSTLSMQLARMLRTAHEERSFSAKAREALLALRIERAVDKRTILEQWLNRAYFGNGVYGFAAASELYFGKPPRALSDGEASLLAVLPRAPSAYDPLRNLDAAVRRRDRVLALLVERGVVSADTAHAAKVTQLAVGKHATTNQAPHFARWILEQLPPHVRTRGGTVHTTLDLRLQRVLQTRVTEQVAALRRRNLDQAGLVVLDTETTGVRAMVGSASWSGPGGQINITTRRRHPGSALKPFVYATSIEQGANPATIAWDVRDASEAYFAPSESVEHGPVRYREALASSYNFAAVDVIDQVGVPRVMSALRKAGVGDLAGAPDDYGLRLALGAAKVRLLDLTASYGFAVKGGFVGTPRGITHATMPDGLRWSPARTSERRVFSPETAWLVMDMLADSEARRPAFGMELPFDLPFRVAAKTGTARGFSDTWAIAATNEVIVGAWAGTFDGTPTQGIVGMDAAAPLARDALLAVAQTTVQGPLTLPARPDTIVEVEVCRTSGMKPHGRCPVITDYAVRGREPTAVDTWHDEDGAIRYPARAGGWLSRRADAMAIRR
ncbi:MAG: transglycosylase domain-containing protein [Kofleriaceae bacterium]|nr:transglycosylase domain-containing protein [Kofleriaceae bacterium]